MSVDQFFYTWTVELACTFDETLTNNHHLEIDDHLHKSCYGSRIEYEPYEMSMS